MRKTEREGGRERERYEIYFILAGMRTIH